MEIKDIISIIGTLFSIAVAIKTLFFSGNKESKNAINIEGNRNTAKIINVDKRTNVINNTPQYVIPQKTINGKSNISTSTEGVLLKYTGITICVIISIVLILVFNTYIVSILSVLVAISMPLNIRRTKKYDLSLKEISLIVMEHAVLSIIVISMLYIPKPIKMLLDQFRPINIKGLSLFVGWLIESCKLIWHSLHGNELFNVGIVVILRLVATFILAYTVLNQFFKKTFIQMVQKFRDDKKSYYIDKIVSFTFMLLFLHSSFIFFPLKETFSPIFKNIGADIGDWLSK